ncbi:MAG: InlB B-repeat-containing protein [Firmicutes bacterium]|nr:InlB B-repeat-containing protein [Bacillota bacterium]
MKRTLSILLAVVLLAGFGAVAAFAANPFEIHFDRGLDPDNTVVLASLPSPNPVTKTIGTDLALPGDRPTRTGYSFIGWADIIDPPSGYKLYQPNELFKSDAVTDNTMRLYAVWEKNILVTFNGNPPAGATPTPAAPAPMNQAKGTSITLPGLPDLDDYAFTGWSDIATGARKYSAGGSVSFAADTTLYAIWEKDSYEVKFNANLPANCTLSAATPLPATKTKNRLSDLTITDTLALDIPLDAPVPNFLPNYTFQGWATTAAGTPLTGGVYKTNADVTLYAIWKGRPITIKYNANGGTGSMADTAADYGKPVALRTNALTHSLGTFQGWATSAADANKGTVAYGNGVNVNFRPADDVNVVDLFAVWKLPSKTALYAKIEEAGKLESWKYTAESWEKLLTALAAAQTVAANPGATQPQIDTATQGLINAMTKTLVGKDFIFTTKYEASFLNWLLFIIGFGWIWMWF